MNPRLRPWILCLFAALALAACGGGGSAGTDSGGGSSAKPGYVLVEASAHDIDEIAEETGATVIANIPGTEVWQVQLPPGMTETQFLALLDDDIRVVEAERDHELDNPEGGASTIPAGTTELAASIAPQTELARIGLPAALLRGDGTGVRVAIVDTGIDPTHPFVAGALDPDGFDVLAGDADPREERDGLDQDGDGLIDEGFGHGTFIASLIHAMAPGARLVAVRVLDTEGRGTASVLAAGITLAADRGVQVINVSIGMSEQSNAVRRAVQYARSRGALVVASVGNTGAGDVLFPSAYSDAFAVTSVGPDDVRASFASFGSGVDLCAPGVNLLGAHPGFPSGTARWSGTSFSAALAAGGAALVLDAVAGLSPENAGQRLRDRSQGVSAQNPGLGGQLGEGRLNVDAATAP